MPITLEEYERYLDAPALCEQLRIRDLLDNVAIQVDGSFVAAYELGGVASLYASDEERNRNKQALEALIRSLPERSLRMQLRFEITEGVGDLLDRHHREQRNPSAILRAIDQEHLLVWQRRDMAGDYVSHLLHAYFIWNPRIHHQSPDFEWKHKMKSDSGARWSSRPANVLSGRGDSMKTSWRSSTV